MSRCRSYLSNVEEEFPSKVKNRHITRTGIKQGVENNDNMSENDFESVTIMSISLLHLLLLNKEKKERKTHTHTHTHTVDRKREVNRKTDTVKKVKKSD